MTPRLRTLLVAGALLILALAWEAYALATKDTVAWSFSRLFWDLAGNPLFVCLFGMLVGHFVFPKSVCLHCGFRPYRRDPLSARAFDAAISDVSACLESGASLPAAKRHAGLPPFEEFGQ